MLLRRLKKKQLRTYLVKDRVSTGLSNFPIQSILKYIGDPDIENNFEGCFVANHMNRLLDYKTMISEKKIKISIYNCEHR